jgi:hypothetical protein
MEQNNLDNCDKKREGKVFYLMALSIAKIKWRLQQIIE